MTIQKEIKNIVFDLGGVLCGLDADRCVKAFRKIGADDIAFYVEEHRVEDLFLKTELGVMSTAGFCDEVRRLTGKSMADRDIVWAWDELLTGISAERRQRLLELRKHYRLFLLSNTNDMHWRKCTEDFFPMPLPDGSTAGVADYFDHCFLSYQLHQAKPSADIFRTVLGQAGLQAEETLFIDDSAANCEAAAALGMQTYHNRHIDDWLRPTVATIGFFDGVHQGHRFLISQVVSAAHAEGKHAVVITFDRHPREVLPSGEPVALLTTLDEKLALLEQTGVDDVVVLPFTREFSQQTARDFMDSVLRGRLHVSKLMIGYDNRFGRYTPGEGFDDYAAYGRELGIEVVRSQVAPQGPVSSSVVRRALAAGDVVSAHRALGRCYSLSGSVVGGHQEGRKLGFPTANVVPCDGSKMIPANGVYAVRVALDGREYIGMMNIGRRPTFDGHEKTLEVHIFDYDGNLYGRSLTVNFVERIRDERRFDSPEELAAQLEHDKLEVTAKCKG